MHFPEFEQFMAWCVDEGSFYPITCFFHISRFDCFPLAGNSAMKKKETNRWKFRCSIVTSTRFFYIVYSLTDRYNKFSEIQILQLLLLFRATQFLELETRNSRKLIVLCQRSIFDAGISGFFLVFFPRGFLSFPFFNKQLLESEEFRREPASQHSQL